MNAAIRPAWGVEGAILMAQGGATGKGGGSQVGSKGTGGQPGGAKGWGGKTSTVPRGISGGGRSPAPGVPGHGKAP